MRRRIRSSSFEHSEETIGSKLTSLPSISRIHFETDVEACNTIVNHFLHGKDEIGRSFLHHAVHALSSNAKRNLKLDALFLIDGMCKRVKELDEIIQTKGKGSKSSHLSQLFLAKDEENGYTPLHYAILQRDLLSMLLLLRHSLCRPEDNKDIPSSLSNQMQHPLRLLDGNIENNELFVVINDLATSADNESLTPLNLLGATSSSELERCRETLHWSFLKNIWKMQINCESDVNEGKRKHRRQNRQRMISFGDERDYLNNDITLISINDAIDRRSRSASFNVHAYSDEEDDVDDDQNDTRGLNEIVSSARTDLAIFTESLAIPSVELLTNDTCSNSFDHGCEVFTFGKADHCALGVPQFALSGRRDRRGDDNFGGIKRNNHENRDHSSSASHKPRRVEAFALGELRREWSTPNLSLLKRKEAVDSPAILVSAASHHTLVVTRGGRLFSFGLGKGGRLGMGDENHRPLPTRIMGPLSKRIVASVAAAENHSLCSTAFDGNCYAWGSNGFGQLGMPSDHDQVSRLSPRRIDELKQVFVTAVAAGSRHSVALSKLGEVYAWGDNRAGQLGISAPSLVGTITLSNTPSGRCSHHPHRVEGLWSTLPRQRVMAICASEFSTLALAMPPSLSERLTSSPSLPVNVVYEWGHGNHVPKRVKFPTISRINDSMHHLSSMHSRFSCINPTSIASATYHNVAITADGRVYTWGLHSESLGIERDFEVKSCDSGKGRATPKDKGHSCSSIITSPQLVVAMLPKNGGGRAVEVSASESHTAIVTADGHLFTWGSSYGTSTLGHKGVKWQPSPRKVKHVHRAVGVSSAKEHTVLLIGTSFPSLPSHNEVFNCSGAPMSNAIRYGVPSLQELAAKDISRNVDMFNVIPVAIVAHRLNCKLLESFCEKFIKLNLDGVLSAANIADLESYLSNKMIFDFRIDTGDVSDGTFHPMLYHLALSKNWMKHCHNILKLCKGSLQSNPCQRMRKYGQFKPKYSIRNVQKSGSIIPLSNKSITICENKASMIKTSDHQGQQTKMPKFEENETFQNSPKSRNFDETKKYLCPTCDVSCPDSVSYTLHMSGRKHRNRFNQKKRDEEAAVAENMMAMKRMQIEDINVLEEGKSEPALKPPKVRTKAWISSQDPMTTGQGANVVPPQRGNSLLRIMNEELKKSANSRQANSLVLEGLGTSKLLTGQAADASILVAKKHSVNSAPPISTLETPLKLPNTLPLSAFVDSQDIKSTKQIRAIGSTWADNKFSVSNSVANLHTTPKTKSFSEIQKEEEELRLKEDQMCHIDGCKWFIQKRERAASIGDIQQQQKEDSDWRQLVEEQKKIEQEIIRERKVEAKKNKAAKRKVRYKKKPPIEDQKNQTLS